MLLGTSTSASDGGRVRVRLAGRRSITLEYGGSCSEEELQEYLQERLNVGDWGISLRSVGLLLCSMLKLRLYTFSLCANREDF